MSKDKKLEIQNSSNYFPDFKHSLQNILREYINILNEYMQYFSCHIEKNNKVKLNIVTKGIESISHIFTFIILYTKNLELTVYHTKKSYLYYNEFINQINDENNSFLKLNCKDAILFIYKKSIFEINKKNGFFIDEKNKYFCDTLNSVSSIMKNIYFYNMQKLITVDINDSTLNNPIQTSFLIDDFSESEKNKKIKKINEQIIKIMQLICKKINEKDFIQKILKIIHYFEGIKLNSQDYLFILKGLLKKTQFQSLTLISLKKKINNKKIELHIKNNNKFIQFICSHK